MSADEHYYRYEWMTNDQWACAQMAAAAMGGFHHLAELKSNGSGISYSVGARLSTFDSDSLTRLVILSHQRCIRASVSPSRDERSLVIALHKRAGRDGPMHSRHPTMDDAIKRHSDSLNLEASS